MGMIGQGEKKISSAATPAVAVNVYKNCWIILLEWYIL